MKRVVIEIEDEYATALTVTAIGNINGFTNIDIGAFDISKKDVIYIKQKETGEMFQEKIRKCQFEEEKEA